MNVANCIMFAKPTICYKYLHILFILVFGKVEMEKNVQITVRLPETTKIEFEKALQRDQRQYSQSQIIRFWIEQFIKSGHDQGRSEVEDRDLLIEILKLQVEIEKKSNEKLSDLLKSLYKDKHDLLCKNESLENKDIELRLDNAMLHSRINNLEIIIKGLRGDFERAEKLALEREPYKSAQKSLKDNENND